MDISQLINLGKGIGIQPNSGKERKMHFKLFCWGGGGSSIHKLYGYGLCTVHS